VHVPFKGSGQALIDVVAGRISMIIDNMPSALPHIKGGKLRALGVTSSKRATALPDVPTVSEAGVPGFDVTGWYGFFAPARTPQEIVAKFHADTVAALADPVIRQRLDTLGVGVVGSTPEQLRAFLKAEMDKWGAIIREAGIKAE
jgi:tripartite-type tricarboxylate transporter receptor subunit TctC